MEGHMGIGMQRETNTGDHKENQRREGAWETSQRAGSSTEKRRNGRHQGKNRGVRQKKGLGSHEDETMLVLQGALLKEREGGVPV